MGLTVTLKRLAYRLAFRVLQVRWALARPVTEGVKCLVCDGERVLLVRHTYGPRAWDLPGGRGRRGEDPLATARREMEEELGLGDARWTARGTLRGRTYGRCCGKKDFRMLEEWSAELGRLVPVKQVTLPVPADSPAAEGLARMMGSADSLGGEELARRLGLGGFELGEVAGAFAAIFYKLLSALPPDVADPGYLYALSRVGFVPTTR